MTPALEPLFRRDVYTAEVAAAALTAAFSQVRGLDAAGLGFVIAATATLVGSGNASHWLAVYVVLLAAGGYLLPARPARPARRDLSRDQSAAARRILSGAALVGGAVLLGFGPGRPSDWPAWVAIAVPVGIAAESWGCVSFERRWPALTPALLVIAAGGIYWTTPNTQQSAVLLGALAAAGAVAWLTNREMSRATTPAVVGLVVWTVAVGGRGRTSAVVGGLACAGLLLVEPVARSTYGAYIGGRLRGNRYLALLVLGPAQLAMVAAAHAAGVLSSTWWAVIGVAATALVALVIVATAGTLMSRTERAIPATTPSDEHRPM